jgi:POT family proton-dependent oligopeptide transporter
MTAGSSSTFFGHPRGLATLFFTEMWERFSYYGMRALLMLFMIDAVETGGFAMGEREAGAIYGLYTFGVYALALPGGWIADRLLGKRAAVLWGGIVIALGHYSLAIPNQATFYVGLIAIAIGTGLLKPNVSAIVGDLYSDKGARRDAGFSIFYMGINIGAFAGPLICGYLGEEVNWHLGFAAAGVGMTAAIIQYVLGRRYLEGAGELSAESGTPERLSQAKRWLLVGVVGLLGLVGVLYGVNSAGIATITAESIANATSYIVTVLAVLYFVSIIVFVCKDGLERQKVLLIALLFVGAAFFWSGFEQAGTTMNLFAEDYTNRVIGFIPSSDNPDGWEMATTWLQSVNPLFIILLAPVVGIIWTKLGDRSPSIGVKFGMGLVLLGVGFLVMLWAAQHIDDGKVGIQWLVACYFFHTVGELVLSPVGLSAVTKLAPGRLVSQMMGTWFMGAALGNLIAGIVAGGLEDSPPSQIFRTAAFVAIGAGIVFLVLSPWMKKLAGGIK